MGLCAIDGARYGTGYDYGICDAWAAYWIGRTG